MVAKNDCFRGEVTLKSRRVAKYEYIKENEPEESVHEVTREENFIDVDTATCTNKESELLDLPVDHLGSDEETANEDEEREFYDLQDLEKMWGEDDIDDVLEKLKFEDALKEIHHNQEKLLQNQTGTQQSLTAIDELLNKRLQKRSEALQIAAFSSVSTSSRLSPRSSMTSVSVDSTPTIVSCTSTPVVTPSSFLPKYLTSIFKPF